MPTLEQRQPFDGEFKKPVVSTKDRAAIQLMLMPKTEEEQVAWVEEYADDVSRAFVKDAELVRLSKIDHAAAAARLKWMLAALKEQKS